MSTAFIFLVVVIFAAIISVIICLVNLVHFGHLISNGLTGRERVKVLPVHVMWVNRFLWSLFTAVMLVEIMVLIQGGRVGNPLLFKIHLLLDGVAVAILICMRWWKHGNAYPVEHKRLFKAFTMVFTVVVITGFTLMHQVLTK